MSFVPGASYATLSPLAGAGSLFLGRKQELDLFVQHIVKSQEPLFQVVSLWGEPGVGTSTLLRRFRDEAHLATGTTRVFTALVDERLVSPLDMLAHWAEQLRLAGAPLPLFERLLASYYESVRRWDAELEAARTTLTHDPAHGMGTGIEGGPMLREFYEQVAQKASKASQQTFVASLSAEETEVIRAFVEDLRWYTASSMPSRPQELQRPQRIMLFCDAEGPVATATIGRLLPHLLQAGENANVVVIVAGQNPLDRSLVGENKLLSLSLARFTEEETRAYLAASGITDATHITTIWHLSGGLPLALSILAALPQEQVDPVQDVEGNLLRWLASQGFPTRQLVLEGALFSRPFVQDDLAAFYPLPEQQIALYRWLIRLPFVQQRALDGRHHYHRLVQWWLRSAFFQDVPQRSQVVRRALAEYYRRVLKRVQMEEERRSAPSIVWGELVQALLWQLLSLPDEASRMSAIELALWAAHQAQHEQLIVNILHDLAQEPLLPHFNSQAGHTIMLLLRYCETDLTDPGWLVAAETEELFALVAHAPEFPSDLLARMYCRRGVVFIVASDFHRALEQFEQALASDPICSAAFLLQGMVYTALHAYQQAIETFDRVIALDASSTLAYLHRGIAYWKRKAYKQALADCDYALALHPHLDEVIRLRSLIYGEMHLKGQELERLNQLIAANPDDIQLYLLRGLTFCVVHDDRHAIEDLDHALTLNAEYAPAYAARGHVYLEMGEIEQARADFQSSRVRDSEDDTVGFLLEWIALCQKSPDAEDAARLDVLAATSQDSPVASLCRGVAALVREQYAEARAVFERITRLDPGNAYAHFWNCLACAFLSRYEEAVAALRQALAAEPAVPAVLLTPLSWLEHPHSDFFRASIAPLFIDC
ncbi:MAG TPA: tetratricopeptide repeat protein [Ktedonobacteraceae bacterium]|nr:tetratricopeptide repeat protein [Ktedonobacteraceae bacterium]